MRPRRSISRAASRAHPQVTAVHHPKLEAPLPAGLTGTTGLFSFEVDAGIDIPSFCDALDLFQLGVSWGGHESLVIPALIARAQAAGPNSALDFGVPAAHDPLERRPRRHRDAVVRSGARLREGGALTVRAAGWLLAACVLPLAHARADTTLKLVEVLTSPERTETLKGLVGAFEKQNPGTHVEITSLAWSSAFEKFATMVSAGDTPDVVEMPIAGYPCTSRTATWRVSNPILHSGARPKA